MLAPHFRIEREIGRGAMGVVLEAEDLRHGRKVAIKVMASELALNTSLRERFLREARASAKLEGEHAVRVFEVSELSDESRTPFMVVELLDGSTLAEAASPRVSPLVVVGWIRQANAGLREAHAKGLIHRDLKPENLFLTRAGVVKVIDFGIVKDTMATAMTATGDGFGSPAYMSPEQIQGRELTPASDVWSLGVTMFELLTGSLPFDGRDLQAVFSSVLHTTAPRALSRRMDLPDALDDIIARCLEKDLGLRYPSIDALDLDLSTFQQQATVEMPSLLPDTARADTPQLMLAETLEAPNETAHASKPAAEPEAPTAAKRAPQEKKASLLRVFFTSLLVVIALGVVVFTLAWRARSRHPTHEPASSVSSHRPTAPRPDDAPRSSEATAEGGVVSRGSSESKTEGAPSPAKLATSASPPRLHPTRVAVSTFSDHSSRFDLTSKEASFLRCADQNNCVGAITLRASTSTAPTVTSASNAACRAAGVCIERVLHDDRPSCDVTEDGPHAVTATCGVHFALHFEP